MSIRRLRKKAHSFPNYRHVIISDEIITQDHRNGENFFLTNADADMVPQNKRKKEGNQELAPSFFILSLALLVKCRIKCVVVLRIEFFLHKTQAFAESLIMDDLALPQKADRVADIMIVHEP